MPLSLLPGLAGLFSPSGSTGSSLPSISTPISSGATSSLNSSGSEYNLNPNVNFGPSTSTYLILAGAAILGLLIWKGRI